MKHFFTLSFFLLTAAHLMAQTRITSFTPASGPVGTTVTIMGKNFKSATSEPVVYFGAVKARVSTTTDSTLTVEVPQGATFQPITVTVNSLTAYAAKPFRVTFSGAASGIRSSSFAAKKDYESGGYPRTVAIGDFDGDGKPDLFVTNQSTGTASVFRNTSSLKNISLGAPVELPMGEQPFGAATGDFDGDGKIDVAVSNSNFGNAGTVSVKRNTGTNGSISFSDGPTLEVGNGTLGVSIADLDRDGKPDLVATAGNSGIIAVFKNTSDTIGHISFSRQTDIRALYHSDNITIADVDGDGRPEIITGDFGGGTISVWANRSSSGNISFGAPVRFATGANPVQVQVADFDNDGKVDIAVSNYSTSTISVFRNQSTMDSVAFAPGQVFSTDLRPRSFAVGDIDGDGKTDIIVPCDSPHAVSVLRNTSGHGVFSFANQVRFGVSYEAPSISVADLDGDSKPEMIVANGVLSIFRNQMDEPIIGSFTPGAAKKDLLVTIRGENFSSATAVSFGGIAAASFSIVSDTLITAKVAAGASGVVRVTTAYGIDSMGTFTYLPPVPVIRSFTPEWGTVGTPIQIVGSNFSDASSVQFGNVQAAQFTINSDTLITAIVGRNGASGNIIVFNPFGSDMAGKFTFIPPVPEIASFTPAFGTVGTVISIKGHNFSEVSSIRLGAMQAAQFTIHSDTLITAIVGKGASGGVIATNEYGSDTVGVFTFTPPVPAITSFTPAAATAGTPVTIRGKNFTWTTGISFGGVNAASYRIVSDSTISAVLGNGNSGAVRVTTEFGADSLGTFILLQPEALVSYPNPAKGVANLAHGASENPAQLLLVDMNGRTVKTIAVVKGEAQTKIDLTSVQQGIYKVIWTDGKTSKSYTIFVQ